MKRGVLTLATILAAGMAPAAQAAHPADAPARCAAAPPAEAVSREWGIAVEGVRLSAAGYVLDFRYRVEDPDKASPLLRRRMKPVLVHPQSGAVLAVPTPGKVGPLKTAALRAREGRRYFVLFANPGRLVSAGSRVCVVMDGMTLNGLVVEG